jgi:hypothetical protein
MSGKLTDLQLAEIALQLRDRAYARSLLTEILRQDPNNLRAWLIYAQAAEQPLHAAYCLQRALRLKPQPLFAVRWLETLSDQDLLDGKFASGYSLAYPQTPISPFEINAVHEESQDYEWLVARIRDLFQFIQEEFQPPRPERGMHWVINSEIASEEPVMEQQENRVNTGSPTGDPGLWSDGVVTRRPTQDLRCPLLGLLDDERSADGYPSPRNACYAQGVKKRAEWALDLEIQQNRCLTTVFNSCPYYQAHGHRTAKPSRKASKINGSARKILIRQAALFFLLILVTILVTVLLAMQQVR